MIGYQQPFQPFPPYQAPSYMGQGQAPGLIKVNGREGAKAYRVPPNSAVPLFDATTDTFFVKTADGLGNETIRTFTFSEELPDRGDEFVTREELRRAIQGLRNGEAGKHAEQPICDQQADEWTASDSVAH